MRQDAKPGSQKLKENSCTNKCSVVNTIKLIKTEVNK